MTKPPAAPLGDPPSNQDKILQAGISNACQRIERTKTFCSKTTSKMKELVFSKLSNLQANDAAITESNQAFLNESSILTLHETKTSSSSSKIQANISEQFAKKLSK